MYAYVADFSIPNWWQNQTAIAVINQTIHKDYDPITLRNDIALLKLLDPVPDSKVLSLCRKSYNSSPLAANGFGTLNEDTGESPDVLQEVRVFERSAKNCSYDWNPEVQICASSNDMNRGPCDGDSGGPLYPVVDGVPTCLYGIISQGYKCGYLAIYTRITHYLNWIKNHM